MSVTISYDDSLEQKIDFSYSPHLEMMASLHVLFNVRHHGLHLQWAVQTKRRMDRRMLSDLRYFGSNFREFLILFDLFAQELELRGFEEETRELEGLSDPEFAYRILRESSSREEIEEALGGGERMEGYLERFQEELPSDLSGCKVSVTAQRSAVRELLSNPPAFRQRLMDFFQRYWEEIFAAEFAHLEPRFLEDITQKALLLRTSDAPTLLTQLSDSVLADREENLLTIRRSMDVTIDARSLDSITLIPTYFGAPHLILGLYDERFHIWYDMIAAGSRHQPEIPPARLVSLMRAVGDEVRLSILKLAAEKRRSTQELAQLLGITAPSVSRHLRILKEAGLLTSEGEGYYVFYSLVPQVAATLGHHLADYLELGQGKEIPATLRF